MICHGDTPERLRLFTINSKIFGNFGQNVNSKTILPRPTGKFPKSTETSCEIVKKVPTERFEPETVLNHLQFFL